MVIWLDADSLPRKVRDIVSRAACKEGIAAVFVANRAVDFEPCALCSMIVVEGDQSADDYIVESAGANDMAVTRDIPLAARLIEKEAVVINDRGDRFDRDTIAERLSQRNWNLALKEAGLSSSGTRSYSAAEVKRFADRFDRELRRHGIR
ncbi:DUF188 domain-containing protein [Marispirochaeta sp.]|jgi:uncharacterized protein|uniref:YaiI/YqxD family protein n=1 Tax=Marispirochaeta sp. TaxID=2038653 RepID=UPI0029C802B8|nr:DUF188 domain-containing protein [Marispirochaeta sp.]